MSENSTQVQTKPKKFKIKNKKNKEEVGNVKTQHIINDDCIKQMKEMNSDSVDIIICDPPYPLQHSIEYHFSLWYKMHYHPLYLFVASCHLYQQTKGYV